MDQHKEVTPHLALPRLRDRHPLPEGEGCASNQVVWQRIEWLLHDDSIFVPLPPVPSPRLAQMPSTFFFTAGCILISSGQGRVKPSDGHFAVASTPILEPKLGRREACSSWSTGPRVN